MANPTPLSFVNFAIQAFPSIAQEGEIGKEVNDRIKTECSRIWRRLSPTKQTTFIERLDAVKNHAKKISENSKRTIEEEEKSLKFLKETKGLGPRLKQCDDMIKVYEDRQRKLSVASVVVNEFRDSIDDIGENLAIGQYIGRLEKSWAEKVEEAETAAQKWRDKLRDIVPQDSRGRRKLHESMLINRHKRRQEKNRRRRFAEARLPDVLLEGNKEARHVFALPTDSGGHGSLSIWDISAQHGNENATTAANSNRQLVIGKVTVIEIDWIDATRWQGNVLDVNSRTHNEPRCHELLQDIDSRILKAKIAIPRLLHHSMNNEDFSYTMYLPYCPFGTLHDLIENTVAARRVIPEPFMWYVFQILVETCLAMKLGHTDPENPEAVSEWKKEIVHRDLKPQNIFLDHPTKGYFELYPTPRIGDFGIAILTSAEDPFNPGVYLSQQGSPGFAAPEQIRYVTDHGDYVEGWPQGEKTNVFGLGRIMYAMVSHKAFPYQGEWLGNGNLDKIDINTEPEARGYSPALRDLITRCTAYNPDSRPNCAMLAKEIDIAISELRLDQGMKIMVACNIQKMVRKGLDLQCTEKTVAELEGMSGDMWSEADDTSESS